MNICVFASGEGTNFSAILKNANKGYLRSKIALLVTNKSDCGAAVTALRNNIPQFYINRNNFPGLSDSEYSNKIIQKLKECSIDFIVLSGFMQIIHHEITDRFRNRIINIHPALLPSFGGKGMYGINVHKAVIASGVKVTGITIHFVNEKYDEGKIIFQKCVEVDVNDDEYSLQKKIKKLEHKYYPFVIKKFEEGKVEATGGRVVIKK